MGLPEQLMDEDRISKVLVQTNDTTSSNRPLAQLIKSPTIWIDPNASDAKDSSLLIIVCVTVLTVLAAACICSIYYCCKKYFLNRQSDGEVTYSGSHFDPDSSVGNKTTDKSSPSPPQIPTIQNAVDQSPSLQSNQIQPQQQTKPSSSFSIIKLFKFPELTRKSYAAQQQPQPTQTSNRIISQFRKSKNSGSGRARQPSNVSPIFMDKMTITADMFAPNGIGSKSKKEIVLFKAASFTE